jgi:hypothetical protein
MSGEDTQLTSSIENVEFFISKLRRYCDGATEEEMEWTPTGIRNPLAWIVRHCTGLFWLSYGRISGKPIPADAKASGIAWGSLNGATFANAEGTTPSLECGWLPCEPGGPVEHAEKLSHWAEPCMGILEACS